jgi:hypothetical protein
MTGRATATSAREQAREILGQRRYQDADVPRPFKKPLDWLGDRVRDVGTWLSDRFDDVDGALPGGPIVVWLLIAALVVGLTVLLARGLIRRRVALPRPGRAAAQPELDPRELEREADAAERAGDFERAVRLRFRAGVLRLERGQVLEPGGLRTTAEIGAVLHSGTYDELGAEFDAIAYGGRPAGEDDAREAREGWAEVLRR